MGSLAGLETNVGAVIFKRLSQLKDRVAPRVASACFSTIWNRWCTPRRFQRRGSPLNFCLLGCPGLAEDSIEHYARRKIVRRVADRFLALSQQLTVGIDHFMLSSEDLKDDTEVLVCIAILVYGTYTATNILRARGPTRIQLDEAFKLLKQSCRNGVMGHSSSSRLIVGIWGNGRAIRVRRS